MSQPLPSPGLFTPTTKASSTRTKMSSASVNLVQELPESPDSRVHDGDVDDNGIRPGGTKFSSRKKWFLLFLFSVSQYLDIASRASALVFIDDIAKDLGITYETSTWILNSYGVTFGSFLLLWGRVSDLYSAKPVFSIAFLWCGIWSIVISFMTEQFSFYVFRALYGIAAAATIPSAFRLILAVFEPGEVQMALALFGMSGALANATGLLIGGAFGQITSTGQMMGWRWFFRGVAAISIPFALIAHLLLPSTRGPHHDVPRKWRHLDLIGSTLILASLLLLNVGLTLGASRGWATAFFIAPFAASWPLAVAFFWWEHRREDDKAVLPKSIWNVPNMRLMTFCGLYLFATIACAQLPLVERYQMVFGESPIRSALRMLPQGLAMCIVAIVTAGIIKKVNNLRLPIGICLIVAASAFIVFIYGDGDIGAKYWKFYVPSFIIGATALAIAFLGINVTIMTSVPSTMAGVAGALWQVSLQTGVVTAYSIQAGLMTIHEGGVSNWSNPSASFWFLFGWGILCGVSVLVFYRKRTIVGEEPLGDKEREAYALETRSPA